MMKIVYRVLSKIIHSFLIIISRILKRRGDIYMLHSVGDNLFDYNITVFSFECLLKKLQNKNVVRLEDWSKSNDFICVTFDDVPYSFYYNAFPLLKKYNIPFTIFVSCSLLDSEKYLSTKMLEEIAACELCTVGSHGCTHSFYADMNKSKAVLDLRNSKQFLERLTNKQVNLYAFPYGSIYACGLKNKKLVKQIYKYGFGTVDCSITKPLLCPKYFLPRINIDDSFIYKLK